MNLCKIYNNWLSYVYLQFVGSRFSNFAFNSLKITFQCFSETYPSRFGELRHPSVTSGDVGGMWMSATLRVSASPFHSSFSVVHSSKGIPLRYVQVICNGSIFRLALISFICQSSWRLCP